MYVVLKSLLLSYQSKNISNCPRRSQTIQGYLSLYNATVHQSVQTCNLPHHSRSFRVKSSLVHLLFIERKWALLQITGRYGSNAFNTSYATCLLFPDLPYVFCPQSNKFYFLCLLFLGLSTANTDSETCGSPGTFQLQFSS